MKFRYIGPQSDPRYNIYQVMVFLPLCTKYKDSHKNICLNYRRTGENIDLEDHKYLFNRYGVTVFGPSTSLEFHNFCNIQADRYFTVEGFLPSEYVEQNDAKNLVAILVIRKWLLSYVQKR